MYSRSLAEDIISTVDRYYDFNWRSSDHREACIEMIKKLIDKRTSFGIPLDVCSHEWQTIPEKTHCQHCRKSK